MNLYIKFSDYFSKLLHIKKEVFSYLLFGGLTTVIDFLVFTIIFDLTNAKLTSNNIAWVLAVIFAYVTNKIFVFESNKYSKKSILKEITSFIGARVFSLLFVTVVLIIAEYIGFNIILAKIFSAIGVVIMNYFFSKFIIFRTKKESEYIK